LQIGEFVFVRNLKLLLEEGDFVVLPALMDEWHHRLAGHVAAEDEDIHAVKFPRIQELAPANIRTVNIRGEEKFGHCKSFGGM